MSIFNVPDGPSWSTVLRLVHRNIDNFTPKERPLLLGLIEDAVRNVSWWAPELEGAEFVAGIGHWLLAGFDNYGSKEPRKRVLKVIRVGRFPRPIQLASIIKVDPGLLHVTQFFLDELLSAF